MANVHNGVYDVAATNSATDQNMEANYLQRLPGELVANIARHVDDRPDLCKQKSAALHAMRLTCKHLYNGSQDQWVLRHVRSLKVHLTREAIEHTSSVLAPAGLIGRARHLTLLGPPTTRRDLHTLAADHVDSLYALLRTFVQQLSGIESFGVQDIQGRDLDILSSCEAALALRVMAEADLPKINEIIIITGKFSSDLVASVLSTYKSTLRSLEIDTITINDKDIDKLLVLIRDELQLVRVWLMRLSIGTPHRPMDAFAGSRPPWAALPREDGCFRGKENRKIESYSVKDYSVTAGGRDAIKFAINKVFERRGSNVFDASMTRESLGV
ncbi:hypothetical protein CKM354_000777300 [Cercospora kikuchii]|uniref:Uncharacterized protein n=1 Tax=Cercospora kikuchii TaxID=84275 RepID=A0A9P3CUH9_9PEZI|nr:uncharacterized protein CKM354_000777300 [Cercospora kikuchii]GIZ44578.1 hypothetical protein CKM354_000777300 [Cercospora kikuchii]